VKVLFSNSTEYVANSYDQFSYGGFNSAGYLKWEWKQMDPLSSRLLKGKLNFLWNPCILYDKKTLKEKKKFFISILLSVRKECIFRIVYNFTN
jgi:hypothetical protein